jgi:two-component system cell cycle response regulator
MQDARESLEVLLRLTARLTEDVPLEESLKAITDASIEMLEVDHASVRLIDASREQLLSGARSGSGEHERPMRIARGEGVIGWVFEHGEPVRIDEVTHDPRWVVMPAQAIEVRSIMAEPLWSSGEVIGVLAVTSPNPAAFREEDQLMLRLLANCCSPPMERARLRRLAMMDDLTSAFNHRYLAPRLDEELERARRTGGDLSVLYMDLDRFKAVNDRYGHAHGDRVLKLFADRVRTVVRRTDVFVRRGGEEFVLLMPATGADQAFATASRIQRELAATKLELGPGLCIAQTVSIGVATWDRAESGSALEHRADLALYEAKRQGRNLVILAPTALREDGNAKGNG